MAKGSSVILAVAAALLFSLMNRAACDGLSLIYTAPNESQSSSEDSEAGFVEGVVYCSLPDKMTNEVTVEIDARPFTQDLLPFYPPFSCKVKKSWFFFMAKPPAKIEHLRSVTLTSASSSLPFHYLFHDGDPLGIDFLDPNTGKFAFTISNCKYGGNGCGTLKAGFTNPGWTFGFAMKDGSPQWRVCMTKGRINQNVELQVPENGFGLCMENMGKEDELSGVLQVTLTNDSDEVEEIMGCRPGPLDRWKCAEFFKQSEDNTYQPVPEKLQKLRRTIISKNCPEGNENDMEAVEEFAKNFVVKILNSRSDTLPKDRVNASYPLTKGKVNALWQHFFAWLVDLCKDTTGKVNTLAAEYLASFFIAIFRCEPDRIAFFGEKTKGYEFSNPPEIEILIYTSSFDRYSKTCVELPEVPLEFKDHWIGLKESLCSVSETAMNRWNRTYDYVLRSPYKFFNRILGEKMVLCLVGEEKNSAMHFKTERDEMAIKPIRTRNVLAHQNPADAEAFKMHINDLTRADFGAQRSQNKSDAPVVVKPSTVPPPPSGKFRERTQQIKLSKLDIHPKTCEYWCTRFRPKK